MDKYAAEHILGLVGEYDARKLKSAFRAKAAALHPDAAEAHGLTVEEATHRMQEVNQAHDLLEQELRVRGPRLVCEDASRPADAARRRRPAARDGYATYNPFEGHRPGAADRSKQQGTREYYWSDPRYQTYAENARRRAQQARDAEPRYYNGEYESLRREPQVFPEDPARPNPGWYRPLWRFFATFPYRFLFLALVCLLVTFTDPFGMSRKIGFVSFEDALLLLAIVNLVVPFVTAPVRAGFLWLVNRARDAAWRAQGL